MCPTVSFNVSSRGATGSPGRWGPPVGLQSSVSATVSGQGEGGFKDVAHAAPRVLSAVGHVLLGETFSRSRVVADEVEASEVGAAQHGVSSRRAHFGGHRSDAGADHGLNAFREACHRASRGVAPGLGETASTSRAGFTSGACLVAASLRTPYDRGAVPPKTIAGLRVAVREQHSDLGDRYRWDYEAANALTELLRLTGDSTGSGNQTVGQVTSRGP